MTAIDERRDRIRADFKARRGYWNDEWEVILGLDPDYMEAYTDLSSYATEHGSLAPKLREFIYIATCATTTHLFASGLRQHLRNALDAGATPEEVMALLALVSSTGIHTFYLTMASLEEVSPGATAAIRGARAAQANRPVPAAEDAIARHTALYGGLSPDVRTAIEADPAFYDRFLGLASVSLGRPNLLPTRDAHLIMMAVHACATGLLGTGVQMHARAALANGATPVEIADVCEQITGMSVHTLSVGVPVLVSELAARAAAAPSTTEGTASPDRRTTGESA